MRLVRRATVKPRPPTLAEVDRIRSAEAFRLADALGNRVWPEWDEAPSRSSWSRPITSS